MHARKVYNVVKLADSFFIGVQRHVTCDPDQLEQNDLKENKNGEQVALTKIRSCFLNGPLPTCLPASRVYSLVLRLTNDAFSC